MGKVSEAAKRRQSRPPAGANGKTADPFELTEQDHKDLAPVDEGEDIEEGEEIEEEVTEEEEEETDEEEDDDFLADDEEDADEEDLKALAKSGGKPGDPGSFTAKRKEVEIDFTASGEAPPAILPGNYNAKVGDVEFKESAAGNPMLEWTFILTAGPHKNANLRYWTSLKPDAMWSSARTLKAIGIPVAGTKFRLNPEKVIGKPAIVQVVHDGRNEDFPHKIQKVLPPDASAIKAAKAAKDLI
jgi:hypothetical protein